MSPRTCPVPWVTPLWAGAQVPGHWSCQAPVAPSSSEGTRKAPPDARRSPEAPQRSTWDLRSCLKVPRWPQEILTGPLQVPVGSHKIPPRGPAGPRASLGGCHVPDARAPLRQVVRDVTAPGWRGGVGSAFQALPRAPGGPWRVPGGAGRTWGLLIQSVAPALLTSSDVIDDIMLTGHDVMCPGWRGRSCEPHWPMGAVLTVSDSRGRGLAGVGLWSQRPMRAAGGCD